MRKFGILEPLPTIMSTNNPQIDVPETSIKIHTVHTSPSGLSQQKEEADALSVGIPSTPSHFRSTSSSRRSSHISAIDSPLSPTTPITPRLHHPPPPNPVSSDSRLTPDEISDLFSALSNDQERSVTRQNLRQALHKEVKDLGLEGGVVEALMHHLWKLDAESLGREEFGQLVTLWDLPSQRLVTEKMDAKSRKYESELPLGRRLLAHWSVEGPMSTFVIFFVGLQIAMGLYYFVHLAQDPRIHVLGWGLAFAKLGSGVLYPSLAFVLFSSSRRLATFLRRWKWISKFINWDRSQYFHAFLGCTILFFGLLHALSHLSGTFVQAVGSDSPLLPNFPHPITYRAMIGTRAGITGVIALTLLFLIVATGMERVRHSHFQIFQYTHLLIWPFIALLLVHGTGDLIAPPVLGYWLIVPMLAVLWDRIPRTINMFRPVRNCSFQVIEDNTVVISIPKASVSWPYRPGQYILLRIQEIGFGQWHPFTIVGSTTSKGDILAQIYMRKAGDWSGQVLDRARAGQQMTVTLDGPFGSPAEQFSKYQRLVIVGAGIGVVPYAGWLRDISPQQTVDFYWIVRERVSFTWFSSLLNTFHLKSNPSAPKGDVTIRTYATGLAPSSTLQYACRVLLEKYRTINHPTSFITGLECETTYGRPDIAMIFQTAQMAQQKAENQQERTNEEKGGRDSGKRAGEDGRIGVFFCGPNYLGMEISDRCRMERSLSGVQWEFVGEVF